MAPTSKGGAHGSDEPTRDDFSALLNVAMGGETAFEGSVVKGKITAIEKDIAVIDVGLNMEGRVALKEFEIGGKAADLKVGDEIEVYLERLQNALGEAVLSRDKARREESWARLEKKFEAKEKVEGVIFNKVKGGFTVDLDGAVAFLPVSQVDIRPVRDIGPLMHQPTQFQILKMDRRRGNIVVSRRSVLEETRAEQRSEIVALLKEGEVIDGVVKNITDYGAFIDLGGIDGLLHVTDMAWRRVNHPSDVINVGDTVKVQIIRINPETQRISLGMKQLLADPWQGIEAKYPSGARYKGTVTNIADYGAFVELEPGVEGLIHITNMSQTEKSVHPSTIVSTGQQVEVQIIEVDSNKRRIKLGLAGVEVDAALSAALQNYDTGRWLHHSSKGRPVYTRKQLLNFLKSQTHLSRDELADACYHLGLMGGDRDLAAAAMVFRGKEAVAHQSGAVANVLALLAVREAIEAGNKSLLLNAIDLLANASLSEKAAATVTRLKDLCEGRLN